MRKRVYRFGQVKRRHALKGGEKSAGNQQRIPDSGRRYADAESKDDLSIFKTAKRKKR